MGESFYTQLSNPIRNQAVIGKAIDQYVDRYSMYSAITRNPEEKKVTGYCNRKDRDDLYCFLFSEWKMIMQELVKRDVLTKDYKGLGRYLVRYLQDKNPKTYEEVVKLMDEELCTDPMAKKAIELFAWNRIGKYSGWEHLHSNYIRYGTSKNQIIRHRLYINCDSTVVHKIALKFIQKCNAVHSSYYLKFDDIGNRSDTLVVYSDRKHLPLYVRILKEIIEEEKLSLNMHTPPLLTSKIGSFIGYGSEPQEKDTSFNEKRAEHLEYCMKNEYANWLKKNKNATVTKNNTSCTYEEYLVRAITQNTYQYYLENTKDTQEERTRKGYQKRDLNTQNFLNQVRRTIQQNWVAITSYLQGAGIQSTIEFPFLNGRIRINSSILEKTRKEQIAFLYHNSESFRTSLLKRIKDTSHNFGIDPENYACDLYVKQELQEENHGVKNLHPTNNVEPNVTYQRAPQRRKKAYIYQPMSEEEIKAAQKKLGF